MCKRNHLSMIGKSSPENILREVKIYLEDINVPNYSAVQSLKKGIKAFPDSNELKEKLREIENSNLVQLSPKTMYGVLTVAIGGMGLGLIYSWAINLTNNFSVVLGVLFVAGSFVILKQYLKEK